MSKRSVAAEKAKEEKEDTITCGDCDTKNPPGSVTCLKCGYEL